MRRCWPPASALAAPAAVNTTTSLVAAPNPVATGATVTLTATVMAADSSSAAGTVQFEVGGTNIGAPVTVSSGTASTMTTFTAAGSQALSAVFTPTSAAAYNGSTGTFSETVLPTTGTEPIATNVPQSGSFTVTIAPGTVPLSPTGLTATGTLQDVTVTDTRNFYPGWAVYGQEANFVGSGTAAGSTISGNQLGWTPTAVGSLVDGATLGPTVAPESPGLGSTPGRLAFAAAGCGFGTNVLGANLTLDIPPSALAGPYAGSLTITYIETQPTGVAGCVPIGVTF